MDYEKKYNEALERAIKIHDEILNNELLGFPDQIREIFPELRGSEDERIRKWLVDYFSSIKEIVWIHRNTITCEQILAWLEKQKEPEKEELVYRLNGLMQEYINEAKDQEEEEHRFKCYKLFWDALEDTSYFEQKEQKPNIELIQRSWYMEGYNDREFGMEPKWIIKTGEGGPKHELNPRYGEYIEKEPKPVEKQDYSGLNDLERAIHRGFLVAGVENVPVTIIKETAQDCLAHLPVEWSKEDENRLNAVVELLENTSAIHPNYSHRKLIIWLKSLRPSWKPREEQMEALLWCVAHLGGADHRVLAELYEHLKKL